MKDEPEWEDLVDAFRVLEEACAHMYEFIMKEKERSDDLAKRISTLEKKLYTFIK